MSSPGDEKALGRRIAFHRGKRGLTQGQLGKMLSRSESWVSQVERGARRIDRMSVLEAVAEALEIELAELAPEANVVAATTRPRAATSLSLALCSSDALHAVLSDVSPVDVERLGRSADQAWEYAHGSQYENLSELLGTLIPELEYATRKTAGSDRRRMCVAKAKAYQAAAGVLSKLGEVGAAWVAVDRAISAAEDADEPLLMAAGAFRLAIVFQGARKLDLAKRAAMTAINALSRLVASGEDEALALTGALYLQLAVASARGNEGDEAYGYLDQAAALARTLEIDRNDYNTEFGPTNVLLHEVNIAVELGDAGRALRVAGKADTSNLSPERQARLLIDVARAHNQRRSPDLVASVLREALRVAPEQVQNHPSAREVLADALRADPANPGLAELSGTISPTI
ncbi:helix-turn-helix domain-containing protein [Actinokineospora terrae]|uniref:Helix-turn-helix domain-containing protein n=1 Tax=Actinokineospora terrae TaxID=155974 RepID=A0A1H9SIU0_9PSEU|nr:helix-turn-helix transcriptional regulator [Actinokineospora terrae]SER84867.1 Helix-turn-helix domain-containing protein [Actinokineospora terrae]